MRRIFEGTRCFGRFDLKVDKGNRFFHTKRRFHCQIFGSIFMPDTIGSIIQGNFIFTEIFKMPAYPLDWTEEGSLRKIFRILTIINRL